MNERDTRHQVLTEEQRVSTAYHEAGHAVVGAIFGRNPTSVDITPDQSGNVGHTRFPNDVPACMKSFFDESPEKKHYLKVRVLTALAGTIAHDIKMPGREHDIGDARDDHQAMELAEESMSWDYDRAGYIARMKVEAAEHLKAHWSTVEALATALLDHSELSAVELADIFNTTPISPK